MTWRRVTVLAMLATLLGGCGPDNDDIGRMILISAPVWFLLGWLALGWLWFLWSSVLLARGISPSVTWWPSALAAVVLVVGAVLGGTAMTRDGWSWFVGPGGGYWFMSLWVGLGYVTLSLLVWRVWFGGRRNVSSFTWALIPLLPVYWLPALPLALSWPLGDSSLADAIGQLYGYAFIFGGIPTAVVVLVLSLEARGHRRRVPGNTSE